MKKIKLLVVAASIAMFMGCTATHSVSLSAKTTAGKKVTAEVSSLNFLGLTPISMEKSSEVIDLLDQQCGGTGVSGISTKYSSTWLFLPIKETIQATAYCN
ncbi:MAG: hypothetical protein OCD01_16185 [Fibrobacterales bacterium]